MVTIIIVDGSVAGVTSGERPSYILDTEPTAPPRAPKRVVRSRRRTADSGPFNTTREEARNRARRLKAAKP